jgi:signal transduction histidine kinase
MFSGIIIYELREFEIISSNFFIDNSVKFGLTCECILLTIAVLERFRINQELAQKTIKENYDKIETQNKELEIVNTELEKLSIVASETNNSVAIYDSDGRLEWCNTYFEIFYQTNLEELIRDHKDTIENIIQNKKIGELLNTCFSTKTPVMFETHVKSKGSQDIWVQTTLTPLIRKGIVFKLIAIDSEITQLKQYEKKLKAAIDKAIESDRLKTVFLGNMSHEIRTPLNGIMGFSELLYNTVLPEEKKKKFLEMIISNGEQLLRIIDDIIDISLIESNQMRIHPVTFDINDLLRSMIEFFDVFKNTINKSHISLILDSKIPPSESLVVADPIRLKQILNNLLRNGLKFTNEGYVKLICSMQNSNLLFCIVDSGIGIDPVKKEIIFERFRQADENMSREYGGTGLGLSISKGIVEIMKGKIWVDTTHVSGSKICFTIPVRKANKKNVDDGDTIQESVPQIKLN